MYDPVNLKFESMSGQMTLKSTSLAEDQLLTTFMHLAQNVQTNELNDHLQSILKMYPNICKKLALDL